MFMFTKRILLKKSDFNEKLKRTDFGTGNFLKTRKF